MMTHTQPHTCNHTHVDTYCMRTHTFTWSENMTHMLVLSEMVNKFVLNDLLRAPSCFSSRLLWSAYPISFQINHCDCQLLPLRGRMWARTATARHHRGQALCGVDRCLSVLWPTLYLQTCFNNFTTLNSNHNIIMLNIPKYIMQTYKIVEADWE